MLITFYTEVSPVLINRFKGIYKLNVKRFYSKLNKT